jgi:hypothetical protein
VLRGTGQVAGDYRVSSKTGEQARTFTHRVTKRQGEAR